MELSQVDKVSENLKILVRTKLWAQLLVAALLGVLSALVLKGSGRFLPPWVIQSITDWAGVPGGIFLALIQMVVLPLIVSSIVISLSGISKQGSAKNLGIISIIVVLVTTLIAAFLGLGITSLLNPGSLLGLTKTELAPVLSPSFVFTPEDLIRLIPENPAESILKGNMLQVLILSIIGGLALGEMGGAQKQSLTGFLESIQALSLRIIAFSMRIAPVAIFGTMLHSVAIAGFSVLSAMGAYLLCSFVGLTALLLVYALMVKFVVGQSPIQFFRKIREVQLLAFSLSSSAATMPSTLQVAKQSLGISDEIADFLIPLGTTINMAGSAIWQSTATLFIAQGFGIHLPLPSLLMIVVITVGASIGTPGVPGAGMGVLAATFSAVGIPAHGITYLLGVDRIVDMGCTVLNVTGDLVLCLIAQTLDRRQKK